MIRLSKGRWYVKSLEIVLNMRKKRSSDPNVSTATLVPNVRRRTHANPRTARLKKLRQKSKMKQETFLTFVLMT